MEHQVTPLVQSASSHLLVFLAVPPGLVRVKAPLGVSQHCPLRSGAHVIKGCKGCLSTHGVMLLNLKINNDIPNRMPTYTGHFLKHIIMQFLLEYVQLIGPIIIMSRV